MEQFIQFISAKLGVSDSVARNAITVLFEFAQKKMDPAEFEKLVGQIPGAAEFMSQAAASTAESAASSGGLGGLFGSLLGGSLGDAAKAYGDLQAAGLSSGQIPAFIQAFVVKAREVAGPEAVDAILTKIPALQSFIK